MPDDRRGLGRFLLGRGVVGVGGGPADQGDPAGPGQLADPVGADGLDERLDLLLLAGDLDHHLVGADVDDPAPEDLDQALELEPLRRAGRRS